MLARLSFSILAIFAASVVLFALTRALPVSAARIALGTEITQQEEEQFERDHGLDRPYAVQYASWLAGALRGDLGRSLITGVQIGDELKRTFPVTMELVVIAFLLALAMGIPLGVAAAIYRDGPVDHASRIFSTIGVAIPGFWLGFLMINLFAVQWRLVPPGGLMPLSAGLGPHLASIALPAFALALHYVAILSRLTRASLIEAMAQDYVRTARAMGLPQRKVLFYALRNALAPTISVAAMAFGYMFGWAIVIERVFNIAGLSRAMTTAISQRDYYMMQAIVLVFTTVFILANLVGDGIRIYLQPRSQRARA